MTRLEQLALAAAVPVGILIGIIDTRAEEVQPAVLLFVVAGAGLGALAPRLAIPVGLLLGLGVPIMHGYVRVNHLPLPYAMDSYASGFLALIPPTVGALLGAWVRGRARLASEPGTTPPVGGAQLGRTAPCAAGSFPRRRNSPSYSSAAAIDPRIGPIQ